MPQNVTIFYIYIFYIAVSATSSRWTKFFHYRCKKITISKYCSFCYFIEVDQLLWLSMQKKSPFSKLAVSATSSRWTRTQASPPSLPASTGSWSPWPRWEENNFLRYLIIWIFCLKLNTMTTVVLRWVPIFNFSKNRISTTSLLQVGYGDIYPQTGLGKFVGTMCAVAGDHEDNVWQEISL